MGTRLTLAFCVYLLYSIRSFDCRVRVDEVAADAQIRADAAAAAAAPDEWRAADTEALVRAKRRTSQVSLIEPPSARWQRSKPKDADLRLGGYEFDNAEEADGPDDSTKDKPAEEEQPADEAAEPEGPEEVVSPLVFYLIVVGIILMTLALLIVGIAILYIICTIPACDKEEDACGSVKGNECSPSRAPASISACVSRCPSPPRNAAHDRRYSEQSVDLVHKSRGSSLSRQSSCRICPRFAAKSSRGRASCASTSTSSSGGGCCGGGDDDAAAVGAATAAGKKDYFVACVCDLPGEEEYSPSASTTTTFGRC